MDIPLLPYLPLIYCVNTDKRLAVRLRGWGADRYFFRELYPLGYRIVTYTEYLHLKEEYQRTHMEKYWKQE